MDVGVGVSAGRVWVVHLPCFEYTDHFQVAFAIGQVNISDKQVGDEFISGTVGRRCLGCPSTCKIQQYIFEIYSCIDPHARQLS
jgi:hypothetical protein